MRTPKLNKKEKKLIDSLLDLFESKKQDLNRFQNQIVGNLNDFVDLNILIHSIKFRIKDADHLREKLERKILQSKQINEKYDISPDNFFTKINDLVGIRLIHLHTKQIEKINLLLQYLFNEQKYNLREGPCARTWDIESKDYFEKIGIDTIDSNSLYTSVHYVIDSNSIFTYTCEIQVRTLMEEVWGEVDHSINYPVNTESIACREQIKALARATSTCSRLVDSIFESHEEHRSFTNTITSNTPKPSK